MILSKALKDKLDRLKNVIENTQNIVIGAGAGLSESAGLQYNGIRFHKHFSDFEQKYRIKDMYTGSFFLTKLPKKCEDILVV